MSQCHPDETQLTFVLMCSGSGSNYQSYRPKLQESQWWMRRDALVRCTCAALYGGGASYTNLCLMKMKRANQTFSTSKHVQRTQWHFQPPTEEHIISAWRKASHNNYQSKSIIMKGCDLVVQCTSESWKNELLYHTDSNPGKAMPTAFFNGNTTHRNINVQKMSKRNLLEYLQSNCANDLEFLRMHHLNSPPNVVLRKTNHNKLTNIYNEWTKQHLTKGDKTSQAPYSSNEMPSLSQQSNQGKKSPLELTFCSILRQNDDSEVDTTVVILHENCQYELECFGTIISKHTEDNGTIDYIPKRIVVVLGAVRDMREIEYKALSAACNFFQIPFIGCHLGKTPEFTSKIVMAMVNHHCTMNALSPAVQILRDRISTRTISDGGILSNLFENANKNAKKNMILHSSTHLSIKSTKLHVICIIPIPSFSVSSDLSERSYKLWSLVRTCVCTLWRSKLVSNAINDEEIGDNKCKSDVAFTSLENALTFLFKDGITITLNQDILVKSLAQKHQAAPSEYQILNTLCEMLHLETYDGRNPTKKPKKYHKWDKICNSIIQKELEEHSCAFAIDFMNSLSMDKETGKVRSILKVAYDSPCDCEKIQEGIFHHDNIAATKHVVFSLFQLDQRHADRTIDSDLYNDDTNRIHDAIISSISKRSIPMIPQCWYDDSIDAAAASITMIQHLHYHNKLFPTLICLANEQNLCTIDQNETKYGNVSFAKRKQKRRKSSKKKRKL